MKITICHKRLIFACLAACFGAPYQPGTPGGAWTPEEVRIMRERITKSVLHRPWTQIRDGAVEAFDRLYGGGGYYYFAGLSGDVSEAAILRLVFHDCTKYNDGTGGCDGQVEVIEQILASSFVASDEHPFILNTSHTVLAADIGYFFQKHTCITRYAVPFTQRPK